MGIPDLLQERPEPMKVLLYPTNGNKVPTCPGNFAMDRAL